MCTYLKNMEGYKLKDLKLKEFDSIQENDLRREQSKKGRMQRSKSKMTETSKLNMFWKSSNEEEVTIDAIPLAVKSPSIVG
ncbi:hypothetical protein Tco_0348977 [Tanacetum coccineum]